MKRPRDVVLALILGVLCHALFAAAIAAMAGGLLTGMQLGLGRLPGLQGWLANLALTLQFPVLHSFFLGRRGRRLLTLPFGPRRGRTLAPTSYVIFASLQLLTVFVCWTPSGSVWMRPAGVPAFVLYGLHAAAWLVLVKAIADAGMGLQTGAIGWTALLRDRDPDYGGMPTRGLFGHCRQPIYLGFFLVLVTAPVWSPDRLLLTAVWSAYCLLGPLLKEDRFEAIHGQAFLQYRQRVPYFVPSIRSRTLHR